MFRTLPILLFFAILCFSNNTFGQTKPSGDQSDSVFYIGENERNYEKLVSKYNTLLFAVCNNDMDVAFEKWSALMIDIENFASQSNVDLKGVKLWINVFWNNDGTIDHIVFYPKPNSKNMNYDLLKSMFANFIKTYQSPLKYTSKVSHYGSAAFPVFSKSIMGTEK